MQLSKPAHTLELKFFIVREEAVVRRSACEPVGYTERGFHGLRNLGKELYACLLALGNKRMGGVAYA